MLTCYTSSQHKVALKTKQGRDVNKGSISLRSFFYVPSYMLFYVVKMSEQLALFVEHIVPEIAIIALPKRQFQASVDDRGVW